ncbi:MAG: hypothetical protein ABIX28_05515 [Vicinamibacterales bacterium]
MRALPLALLAVVVLGAGGAARTRPVETLAAVGGLPAHIAGQFSELSSCQQTAEGEYFVFDRRGHAVYAVAPPYDTARVLIQIGAEPGRLLSPSAFDLGEDGRFVVADSPNRRGRIQVFLAGGARVGGFTLATRDTPTMVVDNWLQSGLVSLGFTGQSVIISQPELGSLISEYSLDGRVSRTVGALRPTGQEPDRDVHLALNTGLPVINPRGGFYFVFLAGVPMYRKYDARGTLLFERHIEGPELDEYVRTRPSAWPRRSTDSGELPIVPPAVRAAAADADGNLWISLSVPYTYVYDASGDKTRTVQFRAAGIVSPRALYFTRNRRVLVTPGCSAFDSRSVAQEPGRGAGSAAPASRPRALSIR